MGTDFTLHEEKEESFHSVINAINPRFHLLAHKMKSVTPLVLVLRGNSALSGSNEHDRMGTLVRAESQKVGTKCGMFTVSLE